MKQSLIITFLAISSCCWSSGTKVGFFLEHLTVRGTEVSTYNYADYNETLLGNESFVIFVNLPPKPFEEIKPCDRPLTVRELFKERFGDRFYECRSLAEMDQILLKERVELLYLQKCGRCDGKTSKVCSNAVHAVFPPLEPHGEVYASISEWLSEGSGLPFVPYMVRLADTKATLHEELGIPQGAVVFGRHGGSDSFDLPFAKEAVVYMALIHPDWYFLFLNTDRFCSLPNVLFLPSTPDLMYKTRFINTCDAMLHARGMGESFGLACGEFSIANKPVITWTGEGYPPYHRCHLEILKDKGIYYNNQQELLQALAMVGQYVQQVRSMQWDAYSEKYSPEVVMRQFDKVFIQPLKK